MNIYILIYAFRYALGRSSYCVAVVTSELKKNWNKLSKVDKIQIQMEINEAIQNENAGMSLDVEQWKEILNLPL